MEGQPKTRKSKKRILKQPETRKAILDLLREGVSIRFACKAVGICGATFFNEVSRCEVFAREVEAAKAEQVVALTKEAFKRAKNGSDKVLIHLLSCLDPRFTKKQAEQKVSQHVHQSNVVISIDEQRSRVTAIASRLGLGNIFESPAEQRPVNGHAAIGSSNGHHAGNGASKDADGPDAAAE